MSTKTVSEIRVETQQLQKRLEECQPGHVVTYEELSKLVGLDVQGDYRHLLTTARSRAERAGGLFSTVVGHGIKRLSMGDSVEEPKGHITRGRRTIRKGMRRSTYIDYASLSPEQRAELNTTRTVMQFMLKASSTNATRRINESVTQSNTALSFTKTLAQFSK